MNIREAFEQIRANENLFARRLDSGYANFYCFYKGVFSIQMRHEVKGEIILGKPIQFANKKGHEEFSMEAIFADYELFTKEELLLAELNRPAAAQEDGDPISSSVEDNFLYFFTEPQRATFIASIEKAKGGEKIFHFTAEEYKVEMMKAFDVAKEAFVSSTEKWIGFIKNN